ncbi:heparan-alpha-glucosaminide N-acetyltransferase [Shinella curvata]
MTTVIDGNGAVHGAETRRLPRTPLIDQLRGVALIAMAIYHFTWDLGFFGYIEPETATTGGWRIFARLIAGSFLFLVGFSLALGHQNGFKARPFFMRLAKIGGTAAIITVATWFAFPDTFIFFGILHAIATASVVGLLFLRLPIAVTLLAAIAAVAAPFYLRAPLFDHPALWWVGLSVDIPRSNDYVPLLPWLAPVLLGISLGKFFVASALPERWAGLGGRQKVWWKSLLETAGRHSLAIYLIHQPLLIALVYSFSLLVPAPAPDPVAGYTKSCMRACEPERGVGFCESFCGCTLSGLQDQNLFADLNRGAIDVTTDERISTISSQCTAKAETTTDLKE